MKLESFKNLQFLSPRLTIKLNHLTKDDTRRINNTINNKLGSASFIVAIGLALVSVVVSLFLQISSGWKQLEVYGVGSIIADIGCFTMSLLAVLLKLLSLRTKNEKKILLLNRLVIDLLYIAITILMFGSFLADAEKGFLSETPTISVSIIAIAFLLIIQPVFVLDSVILNSYTIITMIFLAIFTKELYNIQSFIYYILIVVGFLLLSRFFVSIVFYGEVQRYIQESISNSLLDTVMYDELTHCKNRYALKKYLEEKVPVWRAKRTRLLVVMFDIDNFKEYNDYFSHQVGDGCLKSIAGAVKKAFPSPRLEFYRYGGEEFLLFFELGENGDAKGILERLRLSAVELDIKSPPESPSEMLTISVGAYLSVTDTEFDFEYALSLADTNLYKAKGSGKNICCLNNKLIEKA